MRRDCAKFSTGVILCNKTIRDRLISNARFAIYSGAPSFPMVASMRAGYRLLENNEAEEVSLPFLDETISSSQAPANTKNPEQCPALSRNHHRPSCMG